MRNVLKRIGAREVAVKEGQHPWFTGKLHVEGNLPVAGATWEGDVRPRWHPDPKFRGEGTIPSFCQAVVDAQSGLDSARIVQSNGAQTKEWNGWVAQAIYGRSGWSRFMIIAHPEIVEDGWLIEPPSGL